MEISTPVVAASREWLDLLTRNTYSQANALIYNDSGRTGKFTRGQYDRALAWLRSVELVVDSGSGLALARTLVGLPTSEVSLVLFEKVIRSSSPAWLRFADEFVQTPDDLPVDADDASSALGLTAGEAFLAVRRAHQSLRKVDAERNAAIGEAGEQAVLALIRTAWTSVATQVSAYDDSAGYDIVVEIEGHLTHLEVKTTTSRARSVIYLSRNEYETCMLDPAWRLVVVGLDEETGECVISSLLDSDALVKAAPRDTPQGARWQSAKFGLPARSLAPGLWLNGVDALGTPSSGHGFEWFPELS